MINLLPYNQKRTIKQVLRLRVVNATLVFLLFLVAVGLLLIIPSFVSVNLRYRAAVQSYTALTQGGTFASDESLAALAADIGQLREAYSAGGTFSVLDAIDSINIPPGVTVSNIAMQSAADRSLNLSGISQDRITLQGFISSLKAVSAVASVDNPVSNFVKNQNGQFTITVTFK